MVRGLSVKRSQGYSPNVTRATAPTNSIKISVLDTNITMAIINPYAPGTYDLLLIVAQLGKAGWLCNPLLSCLELFWCVAACDTPEDEASAINAVLAMTQED